MTHDLRYPFMMVRANWQGTNFKINSNLAIAF